jgi:hypothetical protein
MQVYSFSSRHWNIRAFTPDVPGAGLPADYAPWDAEPEQAQRLSEHVVRELEQKGLFLFSVKKVGRRKHRL